eukprot:6820999-Prymnesium_polylepis.1
MQPFDARRRDVEPYVFRGRWRRVQIFSSRSATAGLLPLPTSAFLRGSAESFNPQLNKPKMYGGLGSV